MQHFQVFPCIIVASEFIDIAGPTRQSWYFAQIWGVSGLQISQHGLTMPSFTRVGEIPVKIGVVLIGWTIIISQTS